MCERCLQSAQFCLLVVGNMESCKRSSYHKTVPGTSYAGLSWWSLQITDRHKCRTLLNSIGWRAKSSEAERSMLVGLGRRGAEDDTCSPPTVITVQYSSR